MMADFPPLSSPDFHGFGPDTVMLIPTTSLPEGLKLSKPPPPHLLYVATTPSTSKKQKVF